MMQMHGPLHGLPQGFRLAEEKSIWPKDTPPAGFVPSPPLRAARECSAPAAWPSCRTAADASLPLLVAAPHARCRAAHSAPAVLPAAAAAAEEEEEEEVEEVVEEEEVVVAAVAAAALLPPAPPSSLSSCSSTSSPPVDVEDARCDVDSFLTESIVWSRPPVERCFAPASGATPSSARWYDVTSSTSITSSSSLEEISLLLLPALPPLPPPVSLLSPSPNSP